MSLQSKMREILDNYSNELEDDSNWSKTLTYEETRDKYLSQLTEAIVEELDKVKKEQPLFTLAIDLITKKIGE